MRRTERVQGLRLMKFEEIYGRTRRGALGQSEAAEILGVARPSKLTRGYLQLGIWPRPVTLLHV